MCLPQPLYSRMASDATRPLPRLRKMPLRLHDVARMSGGTVLFAGSMLLIDRVVAGVVQCYELGTLPW